MTVHFDLIHHSGARDRNGRRMRHTWMRSSHPMVMVMVAMVMMLMNVAMTMVLSHSNGCIVPSPLPYIGLGQPRHQHPSDEGPEGHPQRQSHVTASFGASSFKNSTSNFFSLDTSTPNFSASSSSFTIFTTVTLHKVSRRYSDTSGGKASHFRVPPTSSAMANVTAFA